MRLFMRGWNGYGGFIILRPSRAHRRGWAGDEAGRVSQDS